MKPRFQHWTEQEKNTIQPDTIVLSAQCVFDDTQGYLET